MLKNQHLMKKSRKSNMHTDQIQKENTEDSMNIRTRYVSANRFRSTTMAPIEEFEQKVKQNILPETTLDENLLNKITTTVTPLVKEQAVLKTETTKPLEEESQESTKTMNTDFNDESYVTSKYSTTQQFYSEDPVYAKSTITPQFHNEDYLIQSTTPKTFSENEGDHVTEGKTITVAGESGRIILLIIV
ncbi:uncharacterized protein LOC111643924 [Copidosoma floridanum]|uniref:uncharacterized protein LOC111643924 n=1 Tax=Copidosoma floridanum TaxID=29053 RepID=UPI000C6F4FF5|nr:uncharacterized protein LOC111643924 [Copidosoma floridanum]